MSPQAAKTHQNQILSTTLKMNQIFWSLFRYPSLGILYLGKKEGLFSE